MRLPNSRSWGIVPLVSRRRGPAGLGPPPRIAMEFNLFKYILRHSWREQLLIVVVVLISQVPYFLALDLPKTIVNSPIQGKGFASADATARYLAVDIPLPGFLGFLGH